MCLRNVLYRVGHTPLGIYIYIYIELAKHEADTYTFGESDTAQSSVSTAADQSGLVIPCELFAN